MSETVKLLSQKRYNEIRRMVISDSIEIVLNTIASQTNLNEKDKSFTVKKLTKTVELIYELLGELNNDLIPSDLIKSLKPKVSTYLKNKFCYKQPLKSKSKSNKDTNSDIPVIFSPNISTAIEVPFNEVKTDDIKLKKIPEHYHFFIFNLDINGKSYVITYAEENKYSKREIVEILFNNIKVDKSILSSELKNKYNFV